MRFEPAPEDVGSRLDVFLSRRCPDWTRSQLKKLNERGGVRVGGKTVKDGYRLRNGDAVDVAAELLDTGDPDGEIFPEAVALDVRFEDSHFAVIDKPAGMVVHPGAGHRQGTLAHALRARFQDLSDRGGRSRPGIVHRLDRWTSGLVVIAKSNAAHSRLARSFQNRNVRKAYIAAVHGRPRSDAGEIDLTIGRHPTKRTRMVAPSPGGREAHTSYRVREVAPGFALLDVTIRTGRTHQIRVHLAALGNPVVGDPVYGEKGHRAFEKRHPGLERYFLHAAYLAFPHPDTGETMEFRSGLPAELVDLWEALSGR